METVMLKPEERRAHQSTKTQTNKSRTRRLLLCNGLPLEAVLLTIMAMWLRGLAATQELLVLSHGFKNEVYSCAAP